MKILLAVDGSPCSEVVIAELYSRPWPANSEARIVTVDRPLEPDLLRGTSPTVFDKIVKEQRAELERQLRDAAATIAKKAPGLRVTTSLLEGWPKDAIVSEAERWGADLVVVGSHGYGPVRRFFLGSVSLFVVHHAPCSVLVVRRPAEVSAISSSPTVEER